MKRIKKTNLHNAQWIWDRGKKGNNKNKQQGKYFYVYSNLLLNFFSEFLNLQNLKN